MMKGANHQHNFEDIARQIMMEEEGSIYTKVVNVSQCISTHANGGLEKEAGPSFLINIETKATSSQQVEPNNCQIKEDCKRPRKPNDRVSQKMNLGVGSTSSNPIRDSTRQKQPL